MFHKVIKQTEHKSRSLYRLWFFLMLIYTGYNILKFICKQEGKRGYGNILGC